MDPTRQATLAVILSSCFLVGRSPAITLGDGKGTLDVRKGFRVTEVRVFGSERAYAESGGVPPPAGSDDGIRVDQSLHVNVDMEVLPRLSVRGSFDDVSFPAKKSLAVDYRGERVNVTAGDVSVGFSGLEFPMQPQGVFGIRASYQDEEDAATLFGAHVSGAVGGFKGRGDNTPGPYFLPNRKLVQDSERVFVDGQRLFRQTHYTLDYNTGVLVFQSPVDDRHEIVVDYEYQTFFSLDTEKLLAGQYRRSLSEGVLGVAFGTRTGGRAEARRVLAMDGQWQLGTGGSVSGEVSGFQTDESPSVALRGEVAHQLGPVNLRGSIRRVDPTYEGLSSVPPRKDLLEGSLSASASPFRGVSVSSRLYGTRDNLDDDAATPVTRNLVEENDLRFSFARSSRFELTVGNRNEVGLLAAPGEESEIISRGHSLRLGSRYRHDRFLLSSGYEFRTNLVRPGDDPLWRDRHIMQGEVRSRLGRWLYGSTSLTLSLSPEPDGPTGKELTNAWNLSTKFWEIDTNLNYTFQKRLSDESASAHSASLTLRSQPARNLHAHASLQVKGTLPEGGPFIGDSSLSGGLSWQPIPAASMTSTFEQRLSNGRTIGPRVLDFRASWQTRTAFNVSSGLRLEFFDPETESDKYLSRVAFLEATASF